jgi:hypothetical protein
MLRPIRLFMLALVALVLVLPQGAAAQEPTWYSLPYVIGPNPPKVGDQLSGENGGLYCAPACYQQVYQWYHCTANTNYSNCVAASPVQESKYYKVQESDVGWSLVVQVLASSHDCNEANTECRDVTKWKNSLPTAPVQGTQTTTQPGTQPGTPPVAPPPPPPPPPLVVQPAALFPATPGLFYSETLQVTGGTKPYTFSFDGGLLPAGLTFTNDGVLHGVTDSGTGLFTFTVTATDKTGRKVTKELGLVVAAPMIVATSLGLPLATSGSNYSATVEAVGGVVPHSFTLVDGALPQGMALSMGGRLTGVPSVVGTSLFTVRMLDSRGSTGTQTFRLVVERASQTVVKKKPTLLTKKKKKKR